MTKKEVVKTIAPAVAPSNTDELITKGVAEVFEAIKTKKEILKQLEEINSLLKKYGVDSDSTDSNDTVKTPKQELTEANVLSFVGNGPKSKGDLTKQFKGKLETIVSFLDDMEKKGLLEKKDGQGEKKTAIHYSKK